jgi:hypothetical protein
MGSINIGKVLVGGLAAGLVANVIDFVTNTYILAEDWAAFAVARNLDPAAFTSAPVAVTWVVVDFLFGILLVWTYAAIRPRFGPGPKTAICGGLLLYVATSAVVFGFAMMGVLPMAAFVKGSVCVLISTVAASLTGASIYREAEEPARRAAHA